MRRMVPVNVIMHRPQTEAGREVLAKRAADVHAALVMQRLKTLNCPASRKQELLAAVMDTAKKRSRNP